MTLIRQLRSGHQILIDASDLYHFERYPWTCVRGELEKSKKQYALCSTKQQQKRVTLYLHRLITGADGSDIVDHINGNSLDNRRENLRIVSASINCANRQYEPGVSGYRGVHPSAKPGRWRARIKSGGPLRTLGTFASPEEAALAYNHAALKAFGPLAIINQISEN
jgi:hypothetical protein